MFNTATKAQMQELIEYIASKMSVIDVSTIADANNVEEGYFNETDNKFYKEANYTTEITGKNKTIYISLNTDLPYYFNGTDFVALYSSQQNPSFDYSTSEKVVGHWVDGKPIYQKTFEFTVPSGSPFEGNVLNLNISNIKNILSFNGSFCQGNEWNELNSFYTTNCYIYTSVYLSEGNYYLHMRQSGFNNKPGVFTIQYIKTTD